MTVTSSSFGKTGAGEEVTLYTVTNSNQITVKFITYGASIISLETPDAAGKTADIVLGYDTLEPWLKNPTFFGSTIGRCGNRVGKGKFSIDGKDYQLTLNE